MRVRALTIPVSVSGLPFTLLLLTLFGHMSAFATPISEYGERLRVAERRLRDLGDREASSSEVISELKSIREKLESAPPTTNERHAPEAMGRIDNHWLNSEIDSIIENSNEDSEQRRSRLLELADRLARLRESLPLERGSSGSKSIESERRLIESILGRREYRPETENQSSLLRWVPSVRKAIESFLERFFSRFSRSSSGGDSGGSSLFRIPILLLAIGIVTWATIRLMGQLSSKRVHVVRHKRREVLGEVIEENVTQTDILERAKRIAEEGDFRMAVRLVYIAMLLHLEALGRLRLEKAKTNRDYLNSLSGDDQTFTIFSRLTAIFEETWYGESLTSREDFLSFLRQSEAMVAAGEVI